MSMSMRAGPVSFTRMKAIAKAPADGSMCEAILLGSEEGSYLRLLDHSILGWGVIKKRRRSENSGIFVQSLRFDILLGPLVE